jgi:hypothetical protein
LRKFHLASDHAIEHANKERRDSLFEDVRISILVDSEQKKMPVVLSRALDDGSFSESGVYRKRVHYTRQK